MKYGKAKGKKAGKAKAEVQVQGRSCSPPRGSTVSRDHDRGDTTGGVSEESAVSDEAVSEQIHRRRQRERAVGVPHPKQTAAICGDRPRTSTGTGVVWKLDIDVDKSDPGEDVGSFLFTLERLGTDARTDFRLTSTVGWWLEVIVKQAYWRVGGLGNVTVIPTRRMVQMFTECSLN